MSRRLLLHPDHEALQKKNSILAGAKVLHALSQPALNGTFLNKAFWTPSQAATFTELQNMSSGEYTLCQGPVM
jgi:hypothetical protein